MISPDRLAATIAMRLAPTVPKGFRIEADGPAVGVMFAGEWIGGTEFAGWITPSADSVDVERAATAALEAIQDAIIRQLGAVWPGTPSPTAQSPAVPGVRFSASELRLWYGTESEPTLEVDPIPIDELSS